VAARADATGPEGPPPDRSAALTAAIARGDEAAFAAFYELWFERAYAKARGIMKRDEAFCLDVVQEVMLKVARKMRALPDEESVAAWMAQALLTTALDCMRGEARRLRREQAAARPEAEPARAPAWEEAERLSWLRERLAELPATDRAMLSVRFAEDGTLDDVGAAFGISGDAAHGRIWRTLARLRRRAREWFDERLS
jgi:RNA polymerase sigma-70 factor (ECF subfamily)